MKKLLLLLVTAAFIGCTGNQNQSASNSAENTEENTDIKFIDQSITGEDIFKTIIADYQGKPVFVDFWATWCPPCRAAMKSMKPIKEEMGNDVVFVYVTGPSSPEDTWKEMIADIHGNHYYVTEEQWDALLTQFETQGIPTFVIVDKDGNVTNKYTGFPGEEIIKTELSDLIN